MEPLAIVASLACIAVVFGLFLRAISSFERKNRNSK